MQKTGTLAPALEIAISRGADNMTITAALRHAQVYVLQGDRPGTFHGVESPTGMTCYLAFTNLDSLERALIENPGWRRPVSIQSAAQMVAQTLGEVLIINPFSALEMRVGVEALAARPVRQLPGC